MPVAFLANTYHLTKTRSSQFFIDLLQEWFGPVSIVAHQDVWARLPGTRWDLIVAWQHLFAPEELETFGAGRTVLVPMYDDCPKDRDFWIRYRGFKILCFSRTLADLLEPWGLDCHRVTYWPQIPRRQADWTGGLRGFFWPRTDSLDGRQVEVLTQGARWDAFHLHRAHSPATVVFPRPGAIEAQDFVTSDWFEGPSDYADAVARSNVFFAPRRTEGIGMANLEALALGLAVVAPDLPTANEYIAHGVNGWLFDPDDPQPVDFSRAKDWGLAARTQAETGRDRWLQALPGLRKFLEVQAGPPRRRFHPWVAVRGRSWALARTVVRWLKRRFR